MKIKSDASKPRLEELQMKVFVYGIRQVDIVCDRRSVKNNVLYISEHKSELGFIDHNR